MVSLPPEFPPPGAARWGEDVHGVFAGVRARGVPVTLRQVPVGSSWMGSLEDGKGDQDEWPRHRLEASTPGEEDRRVPKA